MILHVSIVSAVRANMTYQDQHWDQKHHEVHKVHHVNHVAKYAKYLLLAFRYR